MREVIKTAGSFMKASGSLLRVLKRPRRRDYFKAKGSGGSHNLNRFKLRTGISPNLNRFQTKNRRFFQKFK